MVNLMRWVSEKKEHVFGLMGEWERSRGQQCFLLPLYSFESCEQKLALAVAEFKAREGVYKIFHFFPFINFL